MGYFISGSSARGPGDTRTTSPRSPPGSTAHVRLPRLPARPVHPEYSIGDFASRQVWPSYYEVKYLPTYEETMLEMLRDRSDEQPAEATNERRRLRIGQDCSSSRGPGPGSRGRTEPEVSGHGHCLRCVANSV
ncbi:unnamed protein product [Lota lota]